MPFEKIIKTIIESNIHDFNKAKYAELRGLCSNYVELVSPQIDLPKIKLPAAHTVGFDQLLYYWNSLNQSPDNIITKHEFKEVGKKSIIRCFYEKIDLVVDTEFYFDNYAKIYKIVNLPVYDI